MLQYAKWYLVDKTANLSLRDHTQCFPKCVLKTNCPIKQILFRGSVTEGLLIIIIIIGVIY